MKVAGKKRKCGICGKKFNANSHNQRYCSEECRCTARRNKAYKWYQKNKENKSSGYFSDKKLNELFEQYLIMREKKGKPVVGYQLKILIDRLNQVAANTKEKIEVVSNAIAGDWNTFYPIKRNTKKNTFAAFEKREYDHDALEKQALLNNRKMFDDMKKGKTNEQI